MKYHDLRDFIAQLEKQGEFKRISAPVSTHLELGNEVAQVMVFHQ
jgi:4-hydroxy-3-polyprenylbenzoate decarboxylase